MEVLHWTHANVRTILDESDAILHAKYQLTYTVGKQMKPDGDSQRWLVAQALLKRVPFHMQELYEKYGKDKVEFEASDPHVFTRCRILDETEVFEDLKQRLIQDFFNGEIDIDFPVIDDAKQRSLHHLITHKAIDRSEFRTIEQSTTKEQNVILILSGLLRFEVLKLALTRRWRVNYGVDANGERKMAIPFKAKDMAAEMAEFGHPDVAVCFTQLTYYYSGSIHIPFKTSL